ncbi:hypothetical protein TeGR_g9484 [Tetraparma gracilis]|uniref:Uncharacterized protein n=1 Tax=Tetraparma gracilis TaxID=2962635 RepID=A0ABQ6MIA2_9STRA|nr:hypothetical protein TeGR_g9484 [Tetraparma gracilis]
MSNQVSPADPLAEARAKWIAAKIGDRALRAAFIRAVTDDTLDYSDAERKQIEEGLKMEAEVTNSSALKPIKMSTPLLEKAVAMTSKDGQHNIVQSSAIVRAPLMDVVAFMAGAEAEYMQIVMDERKSNVWKVLEHMNEHCFVLHWGLVFPSPLQNREAVLKCIFQALQGDCILSLESTEHDAAVRQGDVVRVQFKRLLRFSSVSPSLTRFTATSTFSIGGAVPKFVSDTLTTPAAVRSPINTIGYFLQVKETAELDAAGQDARALGQLLVHEMEPVRTKKRPEELEAKLHVFFYRTTVLREFADVHRWFPKMLFQVLRNKPSRPRTTQAKLTDFTERDAVITGRAMKMLMLSNATPDAAVDEWILTFPALQELETAHPYFRPFMNEITKHILSVADFGLKMRLFSGAGLSIFDLVSDVYMIVVFLGSEETRGVAHVNIVCVALSLGIQLLLVWLVNRKRSWRRIAREVLYVVTFCKPGIDAARVAAGNENDDGLATLDPLAELAISKAAEMVFESIPAAIIQTRAFIVSKERTTLALVSIIISCCTTGFAAATMWYDFDTSPAKQTSCPRLAGATPNTSRGPFFVLLVVSGALQVVAKSFSSALLFIANPNYFIAYTATDHVLYQLYRIARCDHLHFAPGINAPNSFLWRICEKTVVDFTSCWLFRSPIMMHGCYFLFNQLTTFASVFASVYLYTSMGHEHLPAQMLWISAGSISAAWALAYLSLVLMVKPEWRRSFWSTETISQYAHAIFHDNEDDEHRMAIFDFQQCKWEPSKDEVRAFTLANWARWKEETPAWFDDAMIARVPDEYIPIAALASLNAAAHGGQRRRSSLGLAGSVRESARKSSVSNEIES